MNMLNIFMALIHIYIYIAWDNDGFSGVNCGQLALLPTAQISTY